MVICSDKGLISELSALEKLFTVANSHYHWHSNTISLETYPLPSKFLLHLHSKEITLKPSCHVF